jgi:hypothetical protein
LGLDCHGLPDLLFADSFPAFQGAQSLFIPRPVAAKLGDGVCAMSWTTLCASGEMAQQQPFMARILPKQRYSPRFGKRVYLGVAIVLRSESIGIEKNSMLFAAAMCSFSLLDTLLCSFDQRQGIAAGFQCDGVEMDMRARCIEEALKYADIAKLALALATKKDALAWPDLRLRSPHATRGTAP